jgi:hypothetical protein
LSTRDGGKKGRKKGPMGGRARGEFYMGRLDQQTGLEVDTGGGGKSRAHPNNLFKMKMI